jgi:hypothetical protein
MTVHERIAQAMQVIADTDFNKSGTVRGGQEYKYIPIGQILQAIRKAHAKAGLFLTIGQLEYDKDNGEGIFTQDRWTKVRGHCEVSIYGADGDCVSFVVPFNVQDNSDKLDNKIVTNIERQAYRILYAIDEGDATDPESEWHEDRVSVPTEDKFFGKPKAATRGPGNDPEKGKLVDELTKIVMEGNSDGDVIFSMLKDRKLTDCTVEELKEIRDAVRPFSRGGKA